MKGAGFSQDFDFNIDGLLDKTFHSYRKSKTSQERVHYKWNPFNLVNKHYTRNADQAYDNMMESELPKRIYQSRPDLVLNIGNEYLTMMLMEELKGKSTIAINDLAYFNFDTGFYDKSPLDMPKRHIYTRFVRDFKEFTLPKLDYAHYTVPLTAANSNGFVFPGDYVGQYGVYEATKHVYESNENMKHLVEDDYLHVNRRYFASDVEKGVGAIRANFRQQNQIDQDAYSIFIAPGNEEKEAQFCMENLRKGVKEFLLKYSAPSSLSPKALPMDGNFVTVISLHEGSPGAAYVRKYLSENEWTGRLIVVTDENNAHYDAMAASDFGYIYDGQMVSAANALHLPTKCLINMRMHQQWWHDFYNRWWNDMNIVADNAIN